MAFADESDVEAALGRDLTSSESETVDVLLEEATDLIIGYLGCTPDPVPDAVVRVTARMVARVYQQAAQANVPLGATQTQESAGPFSRSTSFATGSSSGAPWLAGPDKIVLSPYRCGGGFHAVALQSAQSGRYRTYD
jgi:hypothetical protein